ncbi:MAG: PhzF family phenazine biosynthesis protein [Anaerolineales bacterium]|nr:PhzF family phenazine biosynthesis protein [Anaerolineales bacterium]
MRLRMYRVDAFTDTVFCGNPAAVVPLKRWLDDGVMQNIAAENNLSETAFFVPDGSAYRLRWFTPSAEVPLCGHATLATAYVISRILQPAKKTVRFHTRSGELTVARKGELLMMDFPRYKPQRCDPPVGLEQALGARPAEVWNTREDPHYYAIFESAGVIRSMAPDMARVAALHPYQVSVSAPGDGEDFVSRFFAPGIGIPEDPVTGSAHCALIPYWAERLGKTNLLARQVSRRGGELICEDMPGTGRVRISGRAVLSLTGYLNV